MTVFKGIHAEIQLRKPAASGTPTALGCCESATLEISHSMEAYYCIGSGDASDIVEGNTEITGTLTRAWIDISLISLLELDANNALTEFDLFFFANPAKTLFIYAYYCKAETGSIDLSQDGFTMHDIDFRAKSWAYGGS